MKNKLKELKGTEGLNEAGKHYLGVPSEEDIIRYLRLYNKHLNLGYHYEITGWDIHFNLKMIRFVNRRNVKMALKSFNDVKLGVL